MSLVRLCIARPVGVAVGVLLVVMFGLIGLGAIPIQLTPTIDLPTITVTTSWPGRSPEEVVFEITQEQEERLKNVTNLRTMRSISSEGASTITLEFNLGSDIRRALQEVSDALRQVPRYPEDVNEPVIKAADGAAANAIAWIIIDVDPAYARSNPSFDITTLFDRLEREVKPFLERIDGVAEINIYGGRPGELRVYLDTRKLADRGLSHLDVIAAIRNENRNISAGTIDDGKREIRIRVIGQFETTSDVLATPIAYRDGKPVYLADVGNVELGFARARGFVRAFGEPCLAMNAIRQGNANVVSVMRDLRGRLDEVKENLLPFLDPLAGPHLRLRQVYDETTYIDSAVSLVTGNLWLGGGLAACVLLLFLRSFVTTGIIALAIPISVIATFLALFALGRTLNVISLAGLAFATGMVVDNSVVVLENIFRRLQAGESPLRAAYLGAVEVWGAILASTMTTIAVFIPVLTIEEEAGQLFRDIALAMAISVGLSLLISITVIPSAASRWLRRPAQRPSKLRAATQTLFGLTPVLAAANRRIADAVVWVTNGWRGWSIRPAIIVVMTFVSVFGSLALMPPMDYLPAGNRNLVFGGLLIPPGYTVEQRVDIAQRIESVIKPYAVADITKPETMAGLPPIFRLDDPQHPFDPVPVRHFFIGAFGTTVFVGATSQNEQVVIPVGHLLTSAIMNIPDAFGGAQQTSIFGRGVGGGNTIDLEISGPSLSKVRQAAGMAIGLAASLEYEVNGDKRTLGFQSIRPEPANFNLRQPEWQIRLNESGRRLGLTTADVGTAVRALFDGAFAGDFRHQGHLIDILLLPEGGQLEYKERLADISVATRSGMVVPLDTVVDVVPALAPQEIQRIEELPAVTIRITPPQGVPLQQLMDALRSEVIVPLRTEGMIDSSMRVRLEGTAAKLDEVKHAMFGDPTEARPDWALGRPLRIAAWGIGIAAFGLFTFALVRAIRSRRSDFGYGAAGFALWGLVFCALVWTVAGQPQLATARFVWALLVTYLLMAALFENFMYPFVIMFTVPMAVIGGFAGLRIVHNWSAADPRFPVQNLDVLTMLGFVVLIGVVVNNAILIVHQSLNFMKGIEGKPLPPHEAVARSVQTRIRPIFMTVATSLGGMCPLVLFPGAGAEMYRGLGSVLLGGLLCSTVFTLLLVPMLFSLTIDMRQGMRAVLGLSLKQIAEPGEVRLARALASHPVHGGVTDRDGTMPDPQHAKHPQGADASKT
ncbi:MAG: efflux RND transporter permease subunit [Phycisphaeraceae bacterium]|nr:efflux RND transporter permease subunit [Phycisphaeraceae bacterium]MCW5754187.1 efflux RND transporter permease subunit [Phycisphaeraceae bacterium]